MTLINVITKKSSLFWAFIFSIFISTLFYQPIYQLTVSLMPKKTISITNLDTGDQRNQIYILGNGDANNIFQDIIDNGLINDWTYKPIGEWSPNFDLLSNASLNESLSFPIKWIPNNFILFWKSSNSGMIQIESEGKKEEFDLYSDLPGGEFFIFYPAAKSYYFSIIHALIYFIFILIVTAFILNIFSLKRDYKLFDILQKEIPDWFIVIVFTILYIFSIIQYNVGIPNFMALGDQVYYWIINLFTDIAREQIVTFRGYICHLLPSISKGLSDFTHINPFYFYFLFLSLLFSWLTCRILLSKANYLDFLPR